MASSAACRCRDGAASPVKRSRTTSDFDSLRLRDSTSIWEISASGSRMVKVFIRQLYYEDGKAARQACLGP